MRINNKSRQCTTYVEAHRRAYAWAEKAMAYRSAGKIAQASAAVAKVNLWLRKVAVLEAGRGM